MHIVPQSTNFAVLLGDRDDKDTRHRLTAFAGWLDATNRRWHTPELAAYRDYLLHDRTRSDPVTDEPSPALLSPASVRAHLATIRGRDRKSTRLNSSHSQISYAVFCL